MNELVPARPTKLAQKQTPYANVKYTVIQSYKEDLQIKKWLFNIKLPTTSHGNLLLYFAQSHFQQQCLQHKSMTYIPKNRSCKLLPIPSSPSYGRQLQISRFGYTLRRGHIRLPILKMDENRQPARRKLCQPFSVVSRHITKLNRHSTEKFLFPSPR